MNYKITINSLKDREVENFEEFGSNEFRFILFDFEIVNAMSPFGKGTIYLFPEAFSNWSSGSQEQLSLNKYIEVTKRIMQFFIKEFPKHHTIFGGK